MATKVITAVYLPRHRFRTEEVYAKRMCTLTDILFVVSKLFGFTMADLKSTKKQRQLFIARTFFVWAAYDLIGFTDKAAIMQAINRDRSNFYHSLYYVDDMYITKQGQQYADKIKVQIKNKLFA